MVLEVDDFGDLPYFDQDAPGGPERSDSSSTGMDCGKSVGCSHSIGQKDHLGRLFAAVEQVEQDDDLSFSKLGCISNCETVSHRLEPDSHLCDDVRDD